MYNRINTWDESKQQYLLENTYAARHNFLMEHAAANTDWFDLLFTNSIMNEHTLSVSSGSQKSKSYISLGFLNDPDGLLPLKWIESQWTSEMTTS